MSDCLSKQLKNSKDMKKTRKNSEYYHTAGASVICSHFGSVSVDCSGFYHWCQWEYSWHSFPSSWHHIPEPYACKSIDINCLPWLTLRHWSFLAHLIDFYQMCYCCRKLEILCILYVWEAEFGRPWEAVGGRAPLIGLERSDSQSGEHGLPRPPTASHGLPQFVMWSVSANQGLARPPTSASHGLPRPRTASHFGLARPPTSASHGLPLRPRTASYFGLPRPPTSASH